MKRKHQFWGRYVLSLLLLASIMLNTTTTVLSLSDKNKQRIIDSGKVNEAYQRMIESFVDFQGNDCFPPYYGGCYVSEDGKMIIQLTDDAPEYREDIQGRLAYQNTVFNTVNYS